ncbi:hypothetical protein PTSG_09275 [Salpingoeca rosetta]|uniref:Acyl-coenzyme A thioesterase 13 n=1 Tax=Salpingoeca rosetta (strain ATCC 50818 / BSB-021) TaxID=946362 RepID=F2UN84_SALR5|nr:uncharacterized protein PTSG_09275 [Salpingoeca rosetta]EGD78583.1 hypothetical protein PTSG_09275 [Salpingoeca rosetta]|eukprot:XP_004989532.1 hypothetical protein PTSG_09275 [Salpingoeca rosetta]
MTSFIQRVAKLGANALLGVFTSSGGFDGAFKELRVVAIKAGSVTATLPVTKPLCNSYGTLHGGAAATLVDIVGTMALLTKDPRRAGVSVDINTSYLRAAKEGEELLITGQVLKTGKKLGFTQVDIARKSDNEVLVTGRHTKAL